MDIFSLVGKITINYADAVNNIEKVSKSAKDTAETLEDVDKKADGAGDSVEDAGQAAKNADSGFTIWKATLANLASTAITKVISGCTQLAEKMADVTKSAVGHYAEYEQLVGGVETLFKDSSGKLIDYAEKAYKTAGMSSNQYMNTATSFAASLIQGLGGDTAKAVELTNLAITDMSDNANKMGIVGFLIPILDGIKNTFTTIWEAIKTAVSTAINNIQTVITTVWNAIVSFLKPILEGIKNTFTTVWNAIKSTISTVLNAIQTTVTSVWNSIKSTISSILNSIKSTFTSVWNSIKSTVSNVINGVKSTISSGLNAAKSTVSNVLGAIKERFSSIFEGAKNIVSNAINRIKSFFNFSWSLPHLKLPHISISGSFSLKPPSVPHFGIEWYKKAMSDGMIMNQPTIFGYNAKSNQFLAGGEAGSETVVGTQNLMDMIQEAVNNAGSGDGDSEATRALLEAIFNWMRNGGLYKLLIDVLTNGVEFEFDNREIARLVKKYA